MQATAEELLSTSGNAPLPLSVRLVDGQSRPLTIEANAGHQTACLRASGLDCNVIARWLDRRGIPLLLPTGDRSDQIHTRLSPTPLTHLATEVLCVDRRVGDLATIYAGIVGRPVREVEAAEDVAAIVRELPLGRSLTLVLLNDRLDEPLCHTIANANQTRKKRGRAAVRYGFLAALTPEHLAWLIVKTWLIYLAAPAKQLTIASWDFAQPSGLVRTRHIASGQTSERRHPAPWSDDNVDVLNVRAHGAFFDLSLGAAVLCGHIEPLLARDRLATAPSCFHDGVCFRMTAGPTAPHYRVLAARATPLVWCLDSCACLPLAGCVFGTGASYAFGLISGAGVGVIGPYLDITTRGGLVRLCEGLIATGSTLGAVVAAASAFEVGDGFDRFLLIGSPDLSLAPVQTVKPAPDNHGTKYRLSGRGQYVWRLEAPCHGARLAAIADDGGDTWTEAHGDPVDDETGQGMIVTQVAPADLQGWVQLGTVENSLVLLRTRTRRIADNLEMLAHYPFGNVASEAISSCHEWAQMLESVSTRPERVRARPDAAAILAHLRKALDDLQSQLVERFLEEVATRDVSLDSIPGHGFELGPTRRTNELCPMCGGNLYLTLGRWTKNQRYRRRWVQCAHCAGIALTRADSPLSLRVQVAQMNPDDDSFEVTVRVSNRSKQPAQALLVGHPRRRGRECECPPTSLMLGPRESRTRRLRAPNVGAGAGVISYRLLVLCDADIQLFALRHPVQLPDGRRSPLSHRLRRN